MACSPFLWHWCHAGLGCPRSVGRSMSICSRVGGRRDPSGPRTAVAADGSAWCQNGAPGSPRPRTGTCVLVPDGCQRRLGGPSSRQTASTRMRPRWFGDENPSVMPIGHCPVHRQESKSMLRTTRSAACSTVVKDSGCDGVPEGTQWTLGRPIGRPTHGDSAGPAARCETGVSRCLTCRQWPGRPRPSDIVSVG